jgi:hypothetical protein
MARGSCCLARRCAALLAVASVMAASWLPLVPAAAAQTSPAAGHRLGCVLIGGRLYLGNPGAGPNPRFVTCAIHFDQVHPRSDGVIVVLRHARRTSAYSILRRHLQLPPAGRQLLRWRHHRGPANIACALAGGRLHLGSTGPARPRKKLTCSVRFYQLAPAADGVIVVLRAAHHRSRYSVVLRKLPHHPTGYTRIRWIR